MLQLPHEVGKRDDRRHQHPQPQPAALEKTALGTEKDSDEYAEHQKSDGVFGLERNAGERAEPEPVSRLAAVDRTEHARQVTHPEKRIKSVYGQPVVKEQVYRGDEDYQCGHALVQGDTDTL